MTKSKSEDSKKLRILAAGDIHGSKDIAEKLAEKAEKNKVDLVILAGDIHGAVEGTTDPVVKPFKKRKQKVVFVPGNWDSSFEVDLLKEMHKLKNIDGYYVHYKDVDILGIGNPDFELDVKEDRAFKKLKGTFEKVKTKAGKKILVSHMHARGTKAEFSGFEGSKAIRKAVDEFEPDILIQGHIHEAEGIEEKIGKTKIINVGRKGKIIEV